MDWNSSALWGIIGLIGGIIVSSFFYFISIKRKSLIYDITTTTLVSKNVTQIENLRIIYNNKPISNLYTSTIKIKNNGNSIIERSDFAPSAPLSLKTDGQFLINSDTGTKLLTENNCNSVYPLIETDENGICKKTIINFDYISKKETISCTVFHTGTLSICGKLKDGKLKNNEKIFKINEVILGAIMGAFISSIGSILIFLLFQ